jgi:hypothetical protein
MLAGHRTYGTWTRKGCCALSYLSKGVLEHGLEGDLVQDRNNVWAVGVVHIVAPQAIQRHEGHPAALLAVEPGGNLSGNLLIVHNYVEQAAGEAQVVNACESSD